MLPAQHLAPEPLSHPVQRLFLGCLLCASCCARGVGTEGTHSTPALREPTAGWEDSGQHIGRVCRLCRVLGGGECCEQKGKQSRRRGSGVQGGAGDTCSRCHASQSPLKGCGLSEGLTEGRTLREWQGLQAGCLACVRDSEGAGVGGAQRARPGVTSARKGSQTIHTGRGGLQLVQDASFHSDRAPVSIGGGRRSWLLR